MLTPLPWLRDHCSDTKRRSYRTSTRGAFTSYSVHLGNFEGSGLTRLHGGSTDRLSKTEQLIATPAAGLTRSMTMQVAYRFAQIDTNCVRDIVGGEESISTTSLQNSALSIGQVDYCVLTLL